MSAQGLHKIVINGISISGNNNNLTNITLSSNDAQNNFSSELVGLALSGNNNVLTGINTSNNLAQNYNQTGSALNYFLLGGGYGITLSGSSNSFSNIISNNNGIGLSDSGSP